MPSAIVVIDLGSGDAPRALDGDPSTQFDKSVTGTVFSKPPQQTDGRPVMLLRPTESR
ncbi:hypothetical protein [Caballeronia cordobensis]|uniref:hypothetical protein n=1 Tax=Caballeronia cordobensis TaxID=1353886 RepID=UPI000A9987F7|nr:hypothetical protein [Caballeronia cordobensis]